MAMEPISGVVSYQAQNIPNISGKQAVPEKPADQFTEVLKDSSKPIDKTTVVVKGKEEAKLESNGGQQEGAQYPESKGKAVVREELEKGHEKERERLKSIVEEMNKKMTNVEAQFGIHEKTNRYTIKIVDKETKEVIKEYPPEKALDLFAKSLELAGIMVDEKG